MKTSFLGDAIAAAVAKGIRESDAGPEKNEMVDRFSEFLNTAIWKGCGQMEREQSLTSLLSTVYFPERQDAAPSYGAEKAWSYLKPCLDHPDWKVRLEATKWVKTIGVCYPSKLGEALALLVAQQEKENRVSAEPLEIAEVRSRLVSELDRNIDCLKTHTDYMKQGQPSEPQWTEAEYLKFKRMDRAQLFEVAKANGIRSQYALGRITAEQGGITIDEIDQLLAVLPRSYPQNLSVIQSLACPLYEPNNNPGKEVVVDHFIEAMRISLETSGSAKPTWISVDGLARIIHFGSPDDRAGVRAYGEDKVVAILIRCLDHGDRKVREYTVNSLKSIAENDPAFAEQILHAFKARFEKEKLDPSTRTEVSPKGFYPLGAAVEELQRRVDDAEKTRKTP